MRSHVIPVQLDSSQPPGCLWGLHNDTGGSTLGHGPLSSLHKSSSGSLPGLTRMASQGGRTPVWPGSGTNSPAQSPSLGDKAGLRTGDDTGVLATSKVEVAVAVAVGSGVGVLANDAVGAGFVASSPSTGSGVGVGGRALPHEARKTTVSRVAAATSRPCRIITHFRIAGSMRRSQDVFLHYRTPVFLAIPKVWHSGAVMGRLGWAPVGCRIGRPETMIRMAG